MKPFYRTTEREGTTMKIITPKNLSGFMELPPKEQVLFEKIKQKLE